MTKGPDDVRPLFFLTDREVRRLAGRQRGAGFPARNADILSALTPAESRRCGPKARSTDIKSLTGFHEISQPKSLLQQVCDTIEPMADFKPRPGTFRPYLEYVNREKPARPSPLTLLEILARQDRQSLPLFGLQTLSGMEPSPYGEALKSLRDADYIVIEGEAPEQSVRLTGAGAEVSRLARPA
jgi:hypothetical protein